MLQDKTQPRRLVASAELHHPRHRFIPLGNPRHTGEWRRTLARLATQEQAAVVTTPGMGTRVVAAVGRALTMLGGQFKQ